MIPPRRLDSSGSPPAERGLTGLLPASPDYKVGELHFSTFPVKNGVSMMSSTATILWAVLFGAIGLGFFTYGKKQRKVVPLFCGVGLFVFPYFISSAYILVLIGICLVILPYFVRI
jgi:hypothetical protein